MILKRELYDILPWWSWLRMRAQVHWWRITGGLARQLGVRGQSTDVLDTELPGQRPRAIPAPALSAVKAQLLAAARICPTGAFEVAEESKMLLLRPSACVLCGLCYFVAPDSLVPQSTPLQALPAGQGERVEFPWA